MTTFDKEIKALSGSDISFARAGVLRGVHQVQPGAAATTGSVLDAGGSGLREDLRRICRSQVVSQDRRQRGRAQSLQHG